MGKSSARLSGLLVSSCVFIPEYDCFKAVNSSSFVCHSFLKSCAMEVTTFGFWAPTLTGFYSTIDIAVEK